MAYVSVAEWRPEQVTEWLKGLDNSIVSYIHWFSNNEVNGQQLLNLSPDELTHLGVYKLGHQELILEAVQHLRNFHYELDRENLQLLALKLSCAAHSLYSEIRDQAESSSVPTQIMADVANVIHYVKPFVSWLDRPPFAGQIQYADYKSQLLSLSLEMATCAQRDRFAERPVAKIRTCSSKLAKLADSLIQDITDPMILQPATLDLATIKKKAGEDLDFFLVPSFHGIHQIGDMKLSSPAHQSGKIQQGDEIVQVNYQTVVGWSRKKVLALFEESPNDLLLTLKRRPRHVKIYGQIYMKPYRLPSRKRALPYSRWNDNLPSPRPELLTIPHFDITRAVNLPKKIENSQHLLLEPSGTSSSSDEEFGQPSDCQSPVSMRLYLPKPSASIQRRFTLSGPPRPSAQSEQFWRELQLERSWRSNQNNSQMNNSSTQNMTSKDKNIDEMFHLRDKSASLGNSIATVSRSAACVHFPKVTIENVKFDLTKFDSSKNDSTANDKVVREEGDKKVFDTASKLVNSDIGIYKNSVSQGAFSENALGLVKQGSLSITELNKLKRDAFFNNMDCPKHSESLKSEPGGSSERVKRVIENFKSEINKSKKDLSDIDVLKSPGKVMELIENFERKETERSKFENFQPEKQVKPVKERNRLDKSSSTPAYDTTEENPVDFKFQERKKIGREPPEAFTEDKKCDYQQKLKSKDIFRNDLEKENISKISTKKKDCREDNFFCAEEDSNECRNKINKNSERYNDNVNLDVRKKINDENLHKKNILPPPESISSEANCNGQNVLLNSGSLPPEIEKPIPAQRKSKLPIEKANNPPGPLPPKPRSKPLPISPEELITSRFPPEPPPRLENTFLKPLLGKKTGISVETTMYRVDPAFVGDNIQRTDSAISLRKSNITISPPLPAPPGTTVYDFKPLSAAPISPVGKTSKSLNPSGGGHSTEKEKSKIGGSTLESLKAMLTLGRKSGNLNSPRSLRKKNALLAKKRNVSTKEITLFENSGFLWHRNRKGSSVASWTRYYFILQQSNFYGFKSKDSNKADLFIHLPGFTCSLAEEVKSKEFSFKIYHTGTVFYFAANSKEDLQQWLDYVNLAVSFQDDKELPETVTYSQTDSDASDSEPEPETCFPTSPKMKKVLGTSPVPKPARSHQNLASDTKKSQENQKRFGSLKKLSSHKSSSPSSFFTGGNESTEVASLDRKYLRFLGHKNSPTPVPTSRFRSYRRMQPPPVILPKGKSKVKSKNLEANVETSNAPTNNTDQTRLTRKPLHSSNPSLIHPEMADYRITQERLAEFRRLRNQRGGLELNRFATDQFLTGQDEGFRSNRNRQPEMGGFMTLEQFLLCQEEERQRSSRLAVNSDFSIPEVRSGIEDKFNLQSKAKVYPGQNKSSTSSQNPTSHMMKIELGNPQVAVKNKAALLNTKVSTKLKNAAMYHPPPIPHSSSSLNQGEDSIVMAFEMALDQNEERKSTENKFSSDREFSRNSKFNYEKRLSSEFSNIEYSPAFEPESYTLQQILKSRQKKDSDEKK